MSKPSGFSHLFVLLQTLHVAQGFASVVQLQQQRLLVTVGAAVLAAGHGQVVQGTETRKADVAADLVDGAIQNDLVLALRGRGADEKQVVHVATL